MHAWRISKADDITGLSGAGAAVYGGRWNPPDVPAVYLGLSPSGCALDPVILAGHVPQLRFKLMHLELPPAPELYETPAVDQLPMGWDNFPADRPSMDYGGEWLERNDQLGLILPSAAMEEIQLVLINPKHPACSQIKVLQITDFFYGKSGTRTAA
jgi:RES domain-containing protein